MTEMKRLKRYDKYYPVQYDYVSELPEGWHLLPNIAIFQERTDRGSDNYELLSISISKGVVKQSDMEKKDISSPDKSNYKVIRVGDIAYGMEFRKGAVGYSIYEGIVSPVYTILKPRKKNLLNSKFFHYMFRTEYYKNYIWRNVYGIGEHFLPCRFTHFKRMYSIVPLLETQNAIVEYLDRKTSQIQDFIRKKERLIELLEESRQRKIFELITGSDLKTKSKESGLDHIGKIPKYWLIINLNSISNVVLGKMLCNENKGNYQYKHYLKSKNIGWENVIVDEVDSMWFSKSEMNTYSIHKNDLLVSEGGEVGKTCIWNDEIEECYIQNSVHKLTFKRDCNPRYYLYYFLILGKGGYFKSIVNQVSIAHLTREKLVKVKCIVPLLVEQNSIVERIEELTFEVKSLIFKARTEIEKIKEYQESLITNVVTGKLKVPESK